MLLDDSISFKQLREIAQKTERHLLKNVTLFDVYTGKNLPKGKKSYALSFTLQDDRKTLTDKQIDKIMSKLQDRFDFVTEIGDSFLESYVPIIERRKNLEYSEENKKWQEVRRGRYVEFNLVHDKGTLFGLKTNGRIESILMSLPPRVQWHYNHIAKEGSEEERLVKVLQTPKNWLK